ncbi:rac GTPase-activating protein 1 isoform X2 [Pygocentrus nattereri]|uniref:rac GTPase-activating protein 1 isoform X2 n=1 Tax=Pygocentrus nattereri TaxID=42514 RepID=UPI001890EB6F|nr:rac GTPase-activating protein 1 isoform X2 [Pygocentrus nattereri]
MMTPRCLRLNTSSFPVLRELFIEVMRHFETVRKKWLHAELELKKYKELLVKSDVSRAALEVKLKHARNQVDVEIKKRYKAEADYQYLERQMLLMSDILVHDNKSGACLNDEQRSMLANFNHRGANIGQRKSKRLSVIDESSFLSHSDISYDRTDDDLDLDSTAVVKPLKSRAREKRRSSMGPGVGVQMQKRGRLGGRSGDLLAGRQMEKETESTVVTASVTTPDNGGQIHMVIDITQETPEQPARSRADLLPSISGKSQSHPDLSARAAQCSETVCVTEQTSVWAPCDVTEAEIVAEIEMSTPESRIAPDLTPIVGTLQHVFLPKTVIRPETCVPCGKRIRFGKVAVKCRDCRVVAHPECKHMCLERCSPNAHGSAHPSEETLESFTPSTRPRVPALIVECVKEIERRGLVEKGLYRVPGGERAVKELRERYISGKGSLMLHKVDEVHVVCGLLKDFLRKLKEPLVTFKLHRTFMDAAELADDDNSSATMFQAVGELPQANRETLAFLMLHLQRVMRSPQCQMDQNNLARVFGPTIIGHGLPEPSPLTIMRDTNTQPKVVSRLLSFPADYWQSFLTVESDQVISSVVDANIGSAAANSDRDRMFKPVTSPELSKYTRTPGSASIKGKIKNLGSAFNNPGKPRTELGKKKFFTSPK